MCGVERLELYMVVSVPRKWSLTFEWIRSVWVGVIFLGKEQRGTVTADYLDQCISMAIELLKDELSEPWTGLSELDKKQGSDILEKLRTKA